MLRTTFVSDRISAYTELVDYLLRLGEVEEAFEVADASRGRALLEHLTTVRRADGNGTAVRSLAEGEELLREIDALVEMLDEMEEIPPDERTSADRETVEHLSRKLIESRNKYESLVVQVAERDAATEALVIGRMGGVVSAVQSALDPGEVLLEYLVTPDRLRLFVVTPMRIHSLESSISAADVASRVRLARGLVGNPSFVREDYPPVLEGLYQALLGPAVRSGALSEARQLIIVPHGVLSYLPFAALRDEVTGRYLLEDYPLQHLPSAAALPILRSQETRPRTGYGTIRSNVFVPFPDRFPASDREARTIRSVLHGTSTHRGGRATESVVLKALRGDGIVHLATHGVLNVQNPMFSMLELRPGVSESPTDDGRLEIHELIGERLQSPLVFLSGCETGVGAAWTTSFAQGEDYATMAKVFLHAGAKNIVATLWRIEDKGAAVFAERFYRHLERHRPAKALAMAQREMVGDPLYSAPFYWAAYQLSGEG
jgi:CHAT domain-containing protein